VESISQKISKYAIPAFLVALIAHAPWHDSLFFGQRPPLSSNPASFLSLITTSGLATFGFLFLFFLVSIPSLFTVIKKQLLNSLDILILGWFLYVIFDTHFWDKSSIIGLAHQIGFCLGLFHLNHRYHLISNRKLLDSILPAILFFSFTLAFVLPQIILIKNHPPFLLFYRTVRFVGWTGEGHPLGVGGFTVAMWAAIKLFNDRRITPISLLGFLAALAGIYFNVSRIASLSSAIMLISFAAISFRNPGTRSIRIPFIVLALLFSSTLLSKQSISKSFTSTYRNKPTIYELTKKIDPRESGKHIKDSLMSGDPSKIENAIVTNGRADALNILYAHQIRNRITGLGSGASRRLLKVEGYSTPELGSDLARIFIEYGYVGFTYFAIMLFMFAIGSGSPAIFPIFAGLSTVMLTEIYLLIPTYGYLCLLMSGMILPYRETLLTIPIRRLLSSKTIGPKQPSPTKNNPDPVYASNGPEPSFQSHLGETSL